MGDVWLGRLARVQGVPMTCLARPRGWLRSQEAGPGIFEAHARSDALQTELIRELAPWGERPRATTTTAARGR